MECRLAVGAYSSNNGTQLTLVTLFTLCVKNVTRVARAEGGGRVRCSRSGSSKSGNV
jgi:hypothetical protein